MTTVVEEKALGDGVEGRGDHGILHRLSSVKATPLEFLSRKRGEEEENTREERRRVREEKGWGTQNSKL